MKHQPLDQVRTQASVDEAKTTLSRRERLLRWAEALRREEGRLLQPLRFVEFYAPKERARLRGEQTPLTVAFADPVLRAAGLSGDTLGEAEAFFELSQDEAHFLLCDCFWNGQMTGGAAAKRVRAVANPHPFNRLWMSVQRG